MTTILGIETSCDETAAAVVLDGKTIASNIVASQVDLHAQYGGVYPELASRAHVEAINLVVEQAITDSGKTWDQIDAIAVTRGPGLVGSLLVGINYAKGLALTTNKPLLGIHHLEGHIYSLWLTQPFREVTFPVICLLVSGGHTELLLMKGYGNYERLGGTLDDAAGEAFDKVARLLQLPYPGGPHIEQAATHGRSNVYQFPLGKRDTSFDFSFSGLKTAVMREAVAPNTKPQKQGNRREYQLRTNINVNDIAASFQKAVVDILVSKTVRAAQMHQATEIFITGGVSANRLLREEMKTQSDLPVRYPPLNLCTDNAAMIAAAGHYRFVDGLRDDLDMGVNPMWRLDNDTYDYESVDNQEDELSDIAISQSATDQSSESVQGC